MSGPRYSCVPVRAIGDRRLKLLPMRVLLALGRHADENGSAFPGLSKIAESTGIPRKKIGAILKNLEKLGYIRRERHPLDDGNFGVNTYTVIFDEEGGTVPHQGPGRGPSPGDRVAPHQGSGGGPSPGDRVAPHQGPGRGPSPGALTTQVSNDPDNDPGENDPKQRPSESLFGSRDFRLKPAPDGRLLVDEFAAWYSRYPRKVGRAVAEKAYARARKKATAQQLLDGLERYVAHLKREGTKERFIAHPTTWLNQERWLDEPQALAPGSVGAIAASMEELGRRLTVKWGGRPLKERAGILEVGAELYRAERKREELVGGEA